MTYENGCQPFSATRKVTFSVRLTMYEIKVDIWQVSPFFGSVFVDCSRLKT